VFLKRVKRFSTGLALVAAVVCARPAAAQSTLFNIPSTDTVAPKKVYFEFDYMMQLPKPDFGQFQVFTPRGLVGITPNAEVGVNYATFKYADDGGTDKIFQPNFKYKFLADDAKGLAASAGVIGYFPDESGDKFGQVYANVSKKMANGSRATVGAYGALSCDACDGAANKVGAIVGYEQPVGGPASFVVDLLTGKNFWGYLTPGVSVVLPHNGLLNIGYCIGWNELVGDGDPDYRNNMLFVYYGIVLN
jgi:hypothetical protein